MLKVYSNRGKAWELANSWWILLTIVPFGLVSFVAFLYIGSKVKNQRWRIFGFIYLAVLIVALITTAAGVGAIIAISLWTVTVIHAFNIRPAYLVQLDVLKANEKAVENQEISKLRQEAETKFGITGDRGTQPPPLKNTSQLEKKSNVQVTSSIKSVVPEEKVVVKIDINLASESEIASIPEIGIILAKKVIIKRQEVGGFQSFEQFSEIMGLREHTIEKIKKYVDFSQVENNNSHTKSGRVIDF
ncbi:ComEA family DNA-binding protein [Aneurinibacillus aneurinilyticus]|uniref:ComEA protein n=1 Tax=Aneurinibacillus aneurinilyticus ATCC 12856 TaxID=649747 RepID=U1YFV8_ANEAE|nr:helix-hairpin-helix domain-containing protein [Aneurinibacillus aneurinilyticus]ERI09676.1 hypothetical protein HMPREF0083_02247 [Aneurinibacillus aneurinilyticus ATCC 12856]MCI1693389.1 helix-hairpin-helix domain-containing protein [Aneurinibacillus aneurinilyticus]MED0707197.1 helix-hairpin-helix domain-containing protein [Aneurinibacillus aneurinilyticus]MED0726524.1 helix-hairpin-helix domain-containing protein [Aneurinibacillus aneurinilyticus]MED0735206.1 helix-hairpin-helix domain-co